MPGGAAVVTVPLNVTLVEPFVTVVVVGVTATVVAAGAASTVTVVESDEYRFVPATAKVKALVAPVTLVAVYENVPSDPTVAVSGLPSGRVTLIVVPLGRGEADPPGGVGGTASAVPVKVTVVAPCVSVAGLAVTDRSVVAWFTSTVMSELPTVYIGVPVTLKL